MLFCDFPLLTFGGFALRYSSPGSIAARADPAHPPDHAERPAQEEAGGANGEFPKARKTEVYSPTF
jgi:hypothetical protein